MTQVCTVVAYVRVCVCGGGYRPVEVFVVRVYVDLYVLYTTSSRSGENIQLTHYHMQLLYMQYALCTCTCVCTV